MTLPKPSEAVEVASSPISDVWERISSRLDNLLLPAEACVAMLFEVPLNAAVAAAAAASQPELVSWLGDVGSPRAATLASRLGEALDRRVDQNEPDPQWAVDGATLVEEIRSEVALSSGSNSSGDRLLFLGRPSPGYDSVVWAAVSAGFGVDLDASDLDGEPDVIVVCPDEASGSLALAADRARQAFPNSALVIAAELPDSADQLAISSRCDALLAGPLRPLAVLDEVRHLLTQRSVALRFVQLASDLGPTAEELRGEGLVVSEADDVSEAMALLAGEGRIALVITTSEDEQHIELIELVKKRPETRRTIIIECVSLRRGRRGTRADLASAGTTPDARVLLRLGAAGVAEAAADVVRRRSQLGAINRADAPAGLPWFSGKARAEQVLQAAQRQDRPASLGLLRFASSVPVAEVDRMQAHLNRQFRDNDVVVRRGDRESLVVVDGIGRRTTMRRLATLIDQLVGANLRACVAEQPYDGRDFNSLLEAADAALDRSVDQDAATVIGVDWQSADLRSDHDVLLVEPDKSLAAVLRGGLGRLGVPTKSVDTADDALAELLDPTKRKPRLVVLEFDLPGQDGLSILRRLDRAGALGRLNVMMLGSRTREADVAAAFELGVVDIVGKPLSPQLTLHRIQRLLSR